MFWVKDLSRTKEALFFEAQKVVLGHNNVTGNVYTQKLTSVDKAAGYLYVGFRWLGVP